MKLKTNKKIISSLMVCLLIATVMPSCKKDKAEDPVTPAPAATTPTTPTTPTAAEIVKQDQTNILTTSNVLADDIVNIMNTQAVEAGTSLVSYMNKDSWGKKGDIKDQVGAKLRVLMYNTKAVMHLNKKKSFAKTTGSEPFDFNSKAGIYTWNNNTQGWDSTGNTTGSIIIKFPADTNNASVNNATLAISSYSEQVLVDSMGGNQYMPTRIVANLIVGVTEYASIDYTGTFNNDGFPVSINLNLFVKPYTLTVLFNNQTTTVTADVKLTNNGQTIIGVNGTLVFTDATQQNIKTIDANVQLKELSLTGSANVAAVEAIQDPKSEDLNNNIKVSLSYKGTKTGDLVFEDKDGATVAMIKFNDGSTKPAEEFFTDVIEKVENALKDAKFAKK